MHKVSTKIVRTVFLSIATSLAMTRIVKHGHCEPTAESFRCWYQLWKYKASLTSDHPPHPPCLPQIACAIQKLLFWTWKNLQNITQHLQSLSRPFSKFDAKFNVNSLLNRHSAIELHIAKKLNQISHSNFLQQAINHIYLWLRKSKNNCDIVSKQLMLRHTVKVLITGG